MKNFLKSWNLFEKLFLLISLLIIIICFFLGTDKNILSLVTSILGVITVIFGAKGLVWAPVVNLLYNIVYIILSYTQGFYGEVLIYIFMMTPINIAMIISWLKNKSKEDENIVEVNKLNKKEYILLFGFTLVVAFGFYFILKALNTTALFISTISLIDSFIATYLLYRRCSNYALSYIVNDIILIVLWFYAIRNNGIAYLPMVLSFLVFLVNDIYGLISWKKRERKQNEKES